MDGAERVMRSPENNSQSTKRSIMSFFCFLIHDLNPVQLGLVEQLRRGYFIVPMIVHQLVIAKY